MLLSFLFCLKSLTGLCLQVMVQYGDGRHGLHDRYSSRHHTGVVSPFGLQSLRVAVYVDCCQLAQLCSYGLKGHTEVYRLSVADTALYASRVIGGSSDALIGAYERIILR